MWIDIVLFVLGATTVLLVVLDILHTTIHVSGSGMLTRRLSLLVWRAWPQRERWLPFAGPTILMVTVLVWFSLFWLGWCLMFASGDPAVVSDPDGTPADPFALIYYVGFSVITLGVGDYAPHGPLWQLLTVVASASGFFLVTLVITYLLPLVSAVVEQRQLAAYIHSIGESPQGLLETGWDGRSYGNLSSHFSSLAPMVHRQTYLHLAYPILHYFRSGSRHSAVAPALALLDESLTLLIHQVPAKQQPPLAQVKPLRGALSELLKTLGAAYIGPSSEPPASAMVEPNLPKGVQDRRCLLLGWLRDQGWEWQGARLSRRANERGLQ